MSTYADFITKALRRLGAVAPDETVSATDISTGMDVFNDLIDSWNTERLAIYTVVNQSFTLTSGKQTYTMGSGGDFNVARPPQIERGVLQVTTVPNAPFEIPLESYTDQQWAAIRMKSIGNTYPQVFYDDGAYPLRSISFWPIPDVNQNFICWYWSPLTQATSSSDTLTFPPGYARAVNWNLALELAAEYPGAANVGLVANAAMEAKAKIRSLNSANNVPFMACDPALTQKGIGWGYYAFLKGE